MNVTQLHATHEDHALEFAKQARALAITGQAKVPQTEGKRPLSKVPITAAVVALSADALVHALLALKGSVDDLARRVER